ncbi:unnamed protein product [Symbiodinium natans]|uniref:Uncharacterized protein n=1 Tax=Symbiodinium natans TaxID=878477 RepID=A0A812RL90_9DINO|nr:unnamed protein product [Symbiodinium natans]
MTDAPMYLQDGHLMCTWCYWYGPHGDHGDRAAGNDEDSCGESEGQPFADNRRMLRAQNLELQKQNIELQKQLWSAQRVVEAGHAKMKAERAMQQSFVKSLFDRMEALEEALRKAHKQNRCAQWALRGSFDRISDVTEELEDAQAVLEAVMQEKDQVARAVSLPDAASWRLKDSAKKVVEAPMQTQVLCLSMPRLLM